MVDATSTQLVVFNAGELEAFGTLVIAALAIGGIIAGAVRRSLAAHEELDKVRFQAMNEKINGGFEQITTLLKTALHIDR